MEDLLGMGGGYVLDLTNREFSSFFNDYKINIDHQKYHQPEGSSKARRMRSFWGQATDPVVGNVLEGLLVLIEDGSITDKHRSIIARLQGKKVAKVETESEFLSAEFKDVAISKVPIDQALVPILDARLEEARRCLKAKAPLATIFHCGGILEGLLLGIASSNPEKFNRAKSSPKDGEGKVLQFPEWNLSQFIDTCCELKYLKLDVKKFSHVLRDFRNYIHPYEQMASGFNPDEHTAKICMQVLLAAIADLSGVRK